MTEPLTGGFTNTISQSPLSPQLVIKTFEAPQLTSLNYLKSTATGRKLYSRQFLLDFVTVQFVSRVYRYKSLKVEFQPSTLCN